MSLAAQLLVATLMVVLTVTAHGYGLMILGRLLQRHLGEVSHEHHEHLTPYLMAKVVAIVLALFALHGIDIWLYAALYHFAGATNTFEEALYFSTFTYSTVGYSDDILHPGWRIVSAIEGVNGFLLLGWSTAFFVSVVARLRRG